jgi:hypothetical protein
MLTDRKGSSESCNTNNKGFIETYMGEGVLISEYGTKLPCKFEAGQLEDGRNVLVCDCSIFDLSLKEYFPDSNFENCSPHDIKICMAWHLWATQYKLFRQFKNFEGITSDGFGEFKITGKVGDYFSIYNDSLRDSSEQVKVAYYVKEFSINENTEENLQFMTFGVTNFDFEGNESQGNVLSLNIKGAKRLIIRKKGEHQDALNFWERFKGIRVTCEVIVEIDKEIQIEEIKDMVNDLCDLMSIACGTRVLWIYCYGYNTEGKIVSRFHRSSITRPYQPMQLIRKDYIRLKKFLEDSYAVFIEKQNLLKQNRYIINKYLEAKAQNDLLEQRGIKLVGIIEMFKEFSIRLNLPTEETIIIEDCFEDKRLDIENALIEAIKQSVNQQYGEESEESRRKIIQENKGKMFAKIPDLNTRRPLKKALQSFCEHIKIQVAQDDLKSIVASRNKLIHEGKFICQTYKDKNKLTQKYPNFKDPWSEYSYSMNFADKCFLRMLGYKGYYINQINFEEEELL